jgi:hypothetical protein
VRCLCVDFLGAGSLPQRAGGQFDRRSVLQVRRNKPQDKPTGQLRGVRLFGVPRDRGPPGMRPLPGRTPDPALDLDRDLLIRPSEIESPLPDGVEAVLADGFREF